MTDTAYCYPPDYIVLRNKLGIRDAAALDRVERRHVRNRAMQGVPSGDFDLAHLRAIHRHLFQDVYDWAGEVRTVEIAKEGHQFQFRRFIETGIADVHARIVEQNYLAGLAPEAFAGAAAEIIGDVNYVHPFREGNGRVQVLYLQQFAARAGHDLAILRIEREAWMQASRRAHAADYGLFAAAILNALASR